MENKLIFYKKPRFSRKRKIFHTVNHGYSLRSLSKYQLSETFEFLEDIPEGCNSTEVHKSVILWKHQYIPEESQPGPSNIQAPREAIVEADSIPDLPEFLDSLQKAQPGTSAMVRRLSKAFQIEDAEVRSDSTEMDSVIRSFDETNSPSISSEFQFSLQGF